MLAGYLVLGGCCFLSGCSSRPVESVRLVLISPHRDEVREEVGLAFQEWFRQRTQERIRAARAVLQAEIDAPSAANRPRVEQAFGALFEDWRPEDVGRERAAYQTWQEQPDQPQNARELLAVLDHWQPRRVELVWLDIGGGTSQIARYINAQFEQVGPSGGIGIDLLFGGGTDIYLRFAQQGVLEPIDLPESLFQHGRIPSQLNGVELYDPQHRWYGAMLSSFGILFNRWVIQRLGLPEPQQWADLGRPEFRGWLSAGDPRLSGSVHMVYEIILQGRGWDEGFRLLMQLGANTHSFIGDSGTLTRVVSLGEVAAVGNVDANALIALARDPEWMAYHLPAGETIINPDAIAVLRGAPTRRLARAFVEFVLSDAGQLLLLLRPGEAGGPRRHPLCRLSIARSLYTAEAFARWPAQARCVGDADPYAVRGTFRYDAVRGTRRWNALNDLLGAVIVDAHPELADAWRAVLNSRLAEEQRRRLSAELFAPFCTEEELTAHARRIVENGPRVRAETVNRWAEEARRRYRCIGQLAREGS